MSAIKYIDTIIATGGNNQDAWVSLLGIISKDSNEYLFL